MVSRKPSTIAGIVVALFGVLGVAVVDLSSGSHHSTTAAPQVAAAPVEAQVPVALPSLAPIPSPSPKPVKVASPAAPPAEGIIPDPVYATTPGFAVAPVRSVRVTPNRVGAGLQVYKADHTKMMRLDDPLYQDVPLITTELAPPTADGWIEVSLPIRPDNTVGWVKAADVTTKTLTYSIDTYLAQHVALVWEGDKLVKSFAMADGAPATPTPTGTFYVLTIIPSYGDYGPAITATSGFSNVYTTFGPSDGDAVTALHGTDVDSSVGRSVSHGCMRVHNVNAAWLGANITPGTLVRIHP